MQITIREPGSAITHFIAMMMAVFAAVPLLVKAGVQSGQENFLAMAIFMGSMILLCPRAFLWLLAGGIIYTVGGVIYALKLPIFNAKHKFFGSHEVFHLFVIDSMFFADNLMNRHSYEPCSKIE